MPDQKLFEEFPPITTEQWMDVVTQDLKGADFEKKLVSKTLDGLKIRPIYRREDVPAEADAAPGQSPFLRGTQPTANHWLLREQIREASIEEANAHILRCLNRGAEEISILTYPMGVEIKTQEDMKRLLDGVFIEMVSIHWMSGTFAPQVLAMYVNEAERRGIALDQLSGSVDFDPIVNAACGWTTASPENWKEVILPLVKFIVEKLPKVKVLGIRGSLIEKAGASVAQELALTLNLLVEYLTVLKDEGYDLNALVPRIEVRFAVGSSYFLEIAKIRAARVLIANVLAGFGVTGVLPHIHVDTTTSNKTLFDPHVNLLRGTTEAMSAALAGIDSLSVSTFDQGYNSPDEFSEHLARNTETLLKEEAFLSKVSDPLAGSYFVESLTKDLALAAWDLFKSIEAEGGFLAAWKSGTIAKHLDSARAQRSKLINSRRRSIIGTSNYPNLKERRLDSVQPMPKENVLKAWNQVSASSFEDLQAAFKAGKSFADWDTDKAIASSPFNPFRPSWPFEHLRLAVEKHVKAGGKEPVVYLALAGHPVFRKARATFVTGFFGCGGYTIVEGTPVKEVADAAKQAKEAKADIVVICSSDDEYVTLVAPLKKALAEVGLGSKQFIVAGAPESAAQLTADGADGFVNIRQDVVAELTKFHAALGIKGDQA